MIKREKLIIFCQSAVNWILLFLVFWLPISFAFFHEINNVFALNKVEYLRVFVSLAFLFFLAKFFLIGSLKNRFNVWLFVAFFLLAMSWLFSSFFAAIPAFAFWGNYERQEGFLTYIFYLLFFIILIFNLDSVAAAKRYLYAIFFSSLVVCLYGLTQFFHLDLIAWAETGRIFSTFGQPNFFGHFLILAIPFSVYGIVFMARRISTRVLLAILLLCQFFCLLFTYSRSAWLGLLAEIFFAVLIWLFLKGRKKIAIGLIILTIIFTGLAASQISFSPKSLQVGYSLPSRIESAFNFSQGSTKVRLNIWQASLDILKKQNLFHWFFGYGPDSLSEISAEHYRGNWALDDALDMWPDRAHDLFLDIVLSFGLTGLAAYFLIFIYFFRQSWRYLKTAPRNENFWLFLTCVLALIGYFFNNLLSFSDIPQYFYFFLILGILSFLLFNQQEERELKINLSVFSRAAIFISSFIFVGIFIFYFNVQPLLADNYFIRAIIYINNDSCASALNSGAKAIALGGGNSLFYQGEYLQLGLLCYNSLEKTEQQNVKNNLLFYLESLPVENYFTFAKYRANVEAILSANEDVDYSGPAEQDFSALALKYPEVSSVYEDWANYHLQVGDADEATDIANKGLSFLPLTEMAGRGYFSHREEIENQEIKFITILGLAQEQKNNFAFALDYYDKIISINPNYAPVYKNIADVYYQQKNFDKAIFYNKKGFQLSPKDSTWPFSLGLLYKEKGDASSSIDYFNQVLQLNPYNKQAYDNIKALKALKK
jgi:O-antigen ligase